MHKQNYKFDKVSDDISTQGKILSPSFSTLVKTCSTVSMDKERNGTFDTCTRITFTLRFRCLRCQYFSQRM